MKKLIYSFFAALVVITSSCRYDDSDLWDSVNNLETRVTNLEALCKQINTNVNSLQTIINALQENDYVTGVNPLYEGGVLAGYTISFTKSNTITIYHGKDGQNGLNGTNGANGSNGLDGKDGQNGLDGKDGQNGLDGYTPLIGVKQDIDGHYYWTLDGEWLLDGSGNKVLAEGTPGKDGQNGADGKDGQNGINGTNGQDGKDGKDGVDGKDGQNGTNGQNGKDGITPQFKIEDGDWYISLDNGLTWQYLGRAQGADGKDGKDGVDGKDGKDGVDGKDGQNGLDGKDGKDGAPGKDGVDGKDGQNGADGAPGKDGVDGKDGQNGKDGRDGQDGRDGDSMFSNIDTSDPDFVIFTLADGTELKLPRYKDLAIEFNESNLVGIRTNSIKKIGYSIIGDINQVSIELLSSGNISAELEKSSALAGNIVIKTGATIGENDKVVVLVSDGQRTIMKNISLEERGLRITDRLNYFVEEDGGNINITIETNAEYSVQIPSEALSWISLNNNNTRNWRSEVITIVIQPNSGVTRTAKVSLLDENNDLFDYIIITQDESLNIPDNMEIAFPDPVFRKIVLFLFDANKDGKISKEEALSAKRIEFSQEYDVSEIESAEGIQYFRNLEYLWLYETCIKQIDLSHNRKLQFLNIAYSWLEKLDITNNLMLTDLECEGCELSELNVANNTELEILNCGENRQIQKLDLSNNLKLKVLEVSELPLGSLDVSKLKYLERLKCGSCGLYQLDVSNNQNLIQLFCDRNYLTVIDLTNNTNLQSLLIEKNNLSVLNISKTKIGLEKIESTTWFNNPLYCSQMENLTELYVKKGAVIDGVTDNRNSRYIPERTNIRYVE
ncbi:MAG: hypothetical protein J1F07_04585 [Muribaculaceae bacterium]|nr:hypothetical protein [Muribaculaceae bacterium]